MYCIALTKLTCMSQSILLQFQFNCNWASWTMKFESSSWELSSLTAPHWHCDHQLAALYLSSICEVGERSKAVRLWGAQTIPYFLNSTTIIQPFSPEVFCNPILSNYVGFYISVVIKSQLMSNINTSSFSPWNVFEIRITLLKSFSI